jgi:hypothetical protein
VAGSDAKISGSDHHAHRGLAEVVLDPVALTIIRWFGRDEGNGRRRTGDVTGELPHLRKFLQLRPIRDDDEVPRLPVP